METQNSDQTDGMAGMAARAVASTAGVVSSVAKALLKDGHLQAAGRQGLDEIGEALKAFPQSIQVQESGTIFNPTQGEIAASRAPDSEFTERRQTPSPSDIARARTGNVYGQERAQSPSIPSPSGIVQADRDGVYGREQGEGQAQPTPSEIARDGGGEPSQEKTGRQREHEHERS